MLIKPLTSLVHAKARQLTTHWAERGQRIKDVNPIAEGDGPQSCATT
jgi:hypothetical protein